MRKKLLSLMPEFQMIEDPDLREKTITIWEDALKEGGWDVDDLPKIPFTLLIEKTDIDLAMHTRAVTLCARETGKVMLREYSGKMNINMDYLTSGSLLHDVGKLFEYKRINGRFVKSERGKLLRHPISGAAFAARYDIPDEILHMIAAHSREGDGARRTIEAIIINHSDFVNFESLKI